MANKYITVSQLNRYISYKFDSDSNLQEVYLQGELSNFKYSGKHCYFSIKDSDSEISAMFFYPGNQTLSFKPLDGMKVNVIGRVQTYQKRGTYSIVVKDMQLEGVGVLYQQFLDLKEKLQKEGLFDPSLKLKIPEYPEIVGVITAPTGDAIHDIISTFNRRLPMAKIKLFPALVQGVDAPKDLVRALKLAYEDKSLDAIIIGRGGGSFEDLSCFNDETLARVLASSKIPTVSAIGHEADYTICDFVSSLRAPTPTGAAIFLTKEKKDVISLVNTYSLRLKNAITGKLTNCYNDLNKIKNSYGLSHFEEILNNYQKTLEGYNRHLDLLSPENLVIKIKKDIENNVKRIDIAYLNMINRFEKSINLTDRIHNSYENIIKINENKLSNKLDKIVLLNPFNIMKKGYGIVYHKNTITSSIKNINKNDEVEIRMSDGSFNATVININKEN